MWVAISLIELRKLVQMLESASPHMHTRQELAGVRTGSVRSAPLSPFPQWHSTVMIT